MNPFLRELGDELRAARRRSGFRLREVTARSEGAFKASAVGGYERGERSISVERFVRLAEAYGVRPDRLLARALSRVEAIGRRDVTIDLQTPRSGSRQDELLAALANDVARMRGIGRVEKLTLRSSDIELLAQHSGVGVQALLSSPFVTEGNSG